MPRTNGLKAPGVEPGQALSRLSYTSFEVCAVFARLTSGWLRMGYAQQIDGMVHQTQTQKEIAIHFLSFSSFSPSIMELPRGFEPPTC